jgi:hypothetical protein
MPIKEALLPEFDTADSVVAQVRRIRPWNTVRQRLFPLLDLLLRSVMLALVAHESFPL